MSHFIRSALVAASAAALTLGSAPSMALAQGDLILPCRPAPCPVGRPCRPCMPVGAMVERVRSDVRAELGARVVRYEIRETFVNRGGGLGEADYLLPLPRNAAFRELRLFINGEPVAGEVMGADRARAIYEEIVRTQRDPALVEWMGHGLLRARIFPIAPGERKEVLVRFDAIAEREGDALRVDYFRGRRSEVRPMPRVEVRPAELWEGEDQADDGRNETFRLRYPAAFGRAYSPTHRVTVREDGRFRVADVQGAGAQLTLLVPVPRASSVAVSALAHAARDDRHVLLTVTPPAVSGPAVARDVTMVLDVSGSMRGEKLEQARAAGMQLLQSLTERDRFRLVSFASDVRAFREEFVPATRGNVSAAADYLRRLRAEGGTNIEEALVEAMRGGSSATRLPLVLFLTDGMPTVGETRADELAELVAARRGNRRIFTFGVGHDVNVALLEQLALDGRGTAHFVRSTESIEHAVSILATRLTEPVLTDVRVEVSGVRLRDVYPRLPADIFAGQDLVLLARYEGSGSAEVRVTGRSGARDVTFRRTVNFPVTERRNDFVPRLWATRRIGHLMAERRRVGWSEEIDGEIRRLAARYGLPSDLSSYLVLEPGMDPRVVAQGSALTGAGSRQRRSAGATDLAGGAVGAPSPPSPPPPPAVTGVQAFESARVAAASRDAATIANEERGASDERHVTGRTFVLRDSAWVQISPALVSGSAIVRIKPYSSAYFQVMDAIPELRSVFALGERVTVRGRAVTIEVVDTGVERLAGAGLAELVRGW